MISKASRLLLIDDDEDDAFIISGLISDIKEANYRLQHVESYDAGIAALGSGEYDACLLDLRLGERTGLEVLSEAQSMDTKCPIILLTGFGDVEIDIEAMKRGAADYLVKDRLTSESLARSLRYAIKRANDLAQLQEQTETFKTLFNSTFEGIIVHRDGMILDANMACGEIFGLLPSAMIGTRIGDYFQSEDPEIFKNSLACTAGVGLEITGRKGEAELSLEIFSREATLKGQAVQITTVQDLSQRKHLEAQVLQQDRLASLGLLASSLAHEIGTPLGVIRGRAEMLQQVIPETSKKNVGVIISQIDRITKLMFSVLQLARGEQTDTITTVNVKTVLDDIGSLLAHEFERKSIALEIDLPSDPMVRAEPGPLGQVLLNLLVNSIHAIEEARAQGKMENHRIRVSATRTVNSLELSLQDSGTGIPKKHLANLFKPFFTTKGIGSGTGLGLAISSKIIQSWGGSISAESPAGSGALFRIVLPA